MHTIILGQGGSRIIATIKKTSKEDGTSILMTSHYADDDAIQARIKEEEEFMGEWYTYTLYALNGKKL